MFSFRCSRASWRKKVRQTCWRFGKRGTSRSWAMAPYWPTMRRNQDPRITLRECCRSRRSPSSPRTSPSPRGMPPFFWLYQNLTPWFALSGSRYITNNDSSFFRQRRTASAIAGLRCSLFCATWTRKSTSKMRRGLPQWDSTSALWLWTHSRRRAKRPPTASLISLSI